MTRLETAIVSLTTGLLCPALGFVLGWWLAAALAIGGVLSLSEPMIALAAFAGLGAGLILDGIYLRRWVARFFTVELRILMLVYLVCSVMAVAAFMGVPVGNLILGGLAGVYLGRREQHTGTGGESAAIHFQRAGLFTAAVTGAEAFAIGLIALNEDWVVEWLQAVSGMGGWALPGAPGISLIIVLCGILMIVQYWLTRSLAWVAFG